MPKFLETLQGPEFQHISDMTKTCFVLLERLDKRILDRHFQKEEEGLESSTSSKSAGKEHKKRARDRPRLLKSYSKTHGDYRGIGERSRRAQESALKGDLIRRKRKIGAKPLHYTDDEEESSGTNPKENFSEKTGGAKLSPPRNGLQTWEKNSDSEIRESHEGTLIENSGKNRESNGRKKPSGKEANGSIVEDSLHKAANEEKQVKADTQPSGVLQKDTKDFAEKMDCVVSDNINDCNVYKVKNEVEIVEGYGKCRSFEGKVSWNKKGKRSKEANDALIEKQDIEDEEHDSRDEDEDDRATVVFEKSFNGSATDFEEVVEMAAGKIRSVNKKFKKKKMMNRKKRTLVKFKRKKSMMGRTLAKVKKLKKRKYSELCGSGQQPAEKAVESVNERHVREICGLVKRLHELYRIISQLQKDLPMDAEHADHFIRTINVQQENFNKEIIKSQKTIIGGYDKMLSSFGSANTVSIEIGKRTSLSKEDIAHVISRCTLQGGCEEKKRAAGTEEQELNSSQELSPKPLSTAEFSKKLGELINDKVETPLSAETVQEVGPPQPVQVEKSAKKSLSNTFIQPGTNPAQGSRTGDGISDPVSIPHPQSLHSSESRHLPKSLQRPSNEPEMAKEVGKGESHPTTHLPSGSSIKASQPFRNNFQGQRCDHSKPRFQFGPQKNCTHRTQGMFRDPRFRRFPQHDPRDALANHVLPLSLRPVHSQSSNTRAHYHGNDFSLHGSSAISYPPNNNTVGFFHVPGGFVLSATPVAGRSPRLHIPSLMDINPYSVGYTQGRAPMCHFPQVPDPYSLPPNVRPQSLLPNFDRSKHGNATSQINRGQKNPSYSTKSCNYLRRRNAFPSSKSSGCNVSNARSQSFPKEDQCPLGNILPNFTGFVQPNVPTQIQVVTEPPGNLEQSSLTADLTGESVKCESYALDPTVPQKLTMRNCRLEAGPVLKPKCEGLESEKGESPSQWQESSSDVNGSEALNQTELKSRVYVCAQNGCKNPGIRICKGCLSIIYCSETCQLKHWTLKHKTECHQLKELRG